MRFFKRNDHLNRSLLRIEEAVSDDLALLLEFGPDYFETHELYSFLHQLEDQTEKVFFLRRMLIATGFIVVVCLVTAIYSFMTDHLLFGYVFLFFIPLFAGLSAMILYRFQKRFSTYRFTDHLRMLIETEIEIRSKDISIL
jgi:Ca2+-dependent lipid-binding protein